MPQPKCEPHQQNIALERFEKALLWKVDEVKKDLGMNRTNAMQHLVWLGLQHMGETRAGVREAYDRQSGGIG